MSRLQACVCPAFRPRTHERQAPDGVVMAEAAAAKESARITVGPQSPRSSFFHRPPIRPHGRVFLRRNLSCVGKISWKIIADAGVVPKLPSLRSFQTSGHERCHRFPRIPMPAIVSKPCLLLCRSEARADGSRFEGEGLCGGRKENGRRGLLDAAVQGLDIRGPAVSYSGPTTLLPSASSRLRRRSFYNDRAGTLQVR